MTIVNKTVNETVELLSWYLLARKIRETVNGIPTSSRSGNQQPSNDLQIDINGDSGDPKEESQWMNTIRDKLNLARKDDVANTWHRLCIYKVPRHLSENDDKSYIPSIVSLGPYHHGEKRLLPMDRHKWRAFDQILKRTNHDAKLYIDSIKELEESARGCYEGHINLTSNEFVEMMVLDGCFILELFRGTAEGFTELGYQWCDPVFAMRESMLSIQRDMIMLENQIPMFILDRLLGLQFSQPEHNSSMVTELAPEHNSSMVTELAPEHNSSMVTELAPEHNSSMVTELAPEHNSSMVTKLALQFFNSLMLTEAPDKMESSPWFKAILDQTHLHCLHVFRQSLLRSEPLIGPTPIQLLKKLLSRKRRTQLIHCVTELKEAGIKFKKRKTDRFWDIKFEKGVLEIPRLFIDDGTKSLFLNLIAFEQSHLDCGNEITAYVIFMDNLINLPEDVGYLHRCGIFEHWLGSDSEVADLFNRLCQEVVFDINNSYLSELSEKVNDFYNQPCNTWRASFVHKYLSNPWTILSLTAAVILLILTFAQTFYAAYGYYRPP